MKQGVELTRFPTVREARFYEKTGVDETVCLACERRCRIKEGAKGFCGTRVNFEGKLYTIVYGDISSISANPIEKKPFFHFHPGSYALTVGTWSCNFSCPWCLDPNTEVLLSDGYTIPIGRLEKCWEHYEIITYDLERKTLVASKIARYFKINPRSKGLGAFKIVTKETGREVIATEEHPFYTPNGYSPLKDLKIGDRVAVYPKFKEWLKEYKFGDEGLVWETIESMEKVEISDVRDLTTVKPTHNFFANGFLVSNCQNYDISKNQPDPGKAHYIGPQQFVDIAWMNGCEGTSISFNEPTLMLEYSLDLFPLARKKGLYNTFVSNGYMTLKALDALAEACLDAIKFDVKGDEEAYEKYCGGVKASVVWRNARRARELGLHVEMVNLVIPGVNDDDDCLRQLVEAHLKELGPDTPLHFTRYHPEYKFKAPPTPVKTLEKARELARSLGVLFPYVGNVPGHRYENTWCPGCGELLIKRLGFNILSMRLTSEGKCPRCGFHVPLIR
ncbi:MAG: radical SAM protein [Candidatus Brockarchaeota archaeon]|nr:radical SAM protein [Candidatus Brockarchaeota archaeon]